MPFGALAYPTAPVVIGLICAVFMVRLYFEDRPAALSLFRNLAIASGIAIALLALKYISPPVDVGPMRAGAELMAMPEMLDGGLNASPYVPVPSLYEELSDLAHPFLFFSAALYFLVLGAAGVAWHRTWTAVLIAAAVGYIAADLMFMRLYIPNRYTRYSLAVVIALWNARNWDLMLDRVPWRLARVGMVVALLGVGGYAYADTFRQGKEAQDRTRYGPLCDFVATLPEGSLIAGTPRRLDDIMLRSERSVLTTFKLAHPWFTTYYAEIEARTKDDLRALFAPAGDPSAINALAETYGVTHIVTDSKDFRRARKRDRVYVKPYSDFVREHTRGVRAFYLETPPTSSLLYQDARYSVIALPLPVAGGAPVP